MKRSILEKLQTMFALLLSASPPESPVWALVRALGLLTPADARLVASIPTRLWPAMCALLERGAPRRLVRGLAAPRYEVLVGDASHFCKLTLPPPNTGTNTRRIWDCAPNIDRAEFARLVKDACELDDDTHRCLGAKLAQSISVADFQAALVTVHGLPHHLHAQSRIGWAFGHFKFTEKHSFGWGYYAWAIEDAHPDDAHPEGIAWDFLGSRVEPLERRAPAPAVVLLGFYRAGLPFFIAEDFWQRATPEQGEALLRGELVAARVECLVTTDNAKDYGTHRGFKPISSGTQGWVLAPAGTKAFVAGVRQARVRAALIRESGAPAEPPDHILTPFLGFQVIWREIIERRNRMQRVALTVLGARCLSIPLPALPPGPPKPQAKPQGPHEGETEENQTD